ncbi:glycosyltransferase family 4 protein [Carnobacteriaceae bacterium zg-84]|uniref:glycosyltransferase family 4 protein n=1 Tax=Granulicatella sp. zg-84 TaxID=2678503 RepID=UPI0013C1CB1E|nr:glycosyltransferase family 4 protein [Granulicatella sp. zg-84]NEW66780.1 glycosyltransferase [Granulicatella sp. zg-84]QMI85350.1 glycosyltransferase family 4 protein [Carnobacteriaceae bacterium zg-84]
MKIAMFTDSYFPQVSGVATSIKILSEELEKMGHDVTIFTTTDPHVDENENNDKIVRIASVPFIFFTDRRLVIGGMNKAYKIAKEKQFDIVHTHTEFGMGLIGKYVAYRLKIPTVHTYHTMYEKYLHYIANGYLVRHSHVRFLSHSFCNHTSGVIAPGPQIFEILKGYDIETDIQIIPTGVPIPEKVTSVRTNIRQALGLSDEHLVLLSLSRLAKEKSLDKIIDAFPHVLVQYPNARLVFVGDGPARKSLEEQVSELSLQDTVIFVGEIQNDDVYKYYQMSDIYVNASESETQGLTYLESLVNGLPVIAKRNDYLSGIITNESLGCLYEDTSQLAKAVIDYVPILNETQKLSNEEKEALSYNVSADKFGKAVEAFYYQAVESYKEKRTNEENPKSSILNRLSFGKWFDKDE